ncbi:MAG: hypothetical protein J5659_06755 [Clostridia bacterium]|nr:hypothetical protein [Clostridia bacterium]
MADNEAQPNGYLTNKELRRLSRRDLLALMLEQAKQIEKLKERIDVEKQHYQQEIAKKESAYKEKIEVLRKEKDAKIEILNQKLLYAERNRGFFGSVDHTGSRKKSFFGNLMKELFSDRK